MLWKQQCSRYGISIKFTSAHNQEIDGQTKNANKIIKNYLCAYINYTQNDWVDNLLIAEFAVTNHVNMSMGVTSFFADYGFYFWTSIESPGIYKGEQKIKLLATHKITKKQAEMMIFLQDQLV